MKWFTGITWIFFQKISMASWLCFRMRISTNPFCRLDGGNGAKNQTDWSCGWFCRRAVGVNHPETTRHPILTKPTNYLASFYPCWWTLMPLKALYLCEINELSRLNLNTIPVKIRFKWWDCWWWWLTEKIFFPFFFVHF